MAPSGHKLGNTGIMNNEYVNKEVGRETMTEPHRGISLVT